MPERIGTIHTDGTRTMPALDINGLAYDLPATTIGIGGNRFVVVPPGFADTERLAEFAPKPSTPTRRTAIASIEDTISGA